MSEISVRALLVEDNSADARLIREMLSEVEGFHIEIECTARLSSALARLGAGGIDVALVDLTLPDSQGFDTFAKINSEVPDLPIILLTGLDDEEVAVSAVREGAQDYVPKSRVDGELLSRAIRYAIERKRTERDLHYQTRIERLISSISSTFAGLPLNEIDSGINQALRLMGEFTSSDRSYVFLLSDDGTRMSNTHEWCASGVSSEKVNLQNLDIAMFQWSLNRLRAGQVIVIPDVASLSDDAAPEREVLEAQGIRSLVLVPVASENGQAGFIGFDAVRHHREWAESEIGVLKTAAEIIGAQVSRHEANRKLAEREEQLSLVVESTPGCIFYIRDENGKVIYVSPSVEAVTGRSPEEWGSGYETFLTDNPINASARKWTEHALGDGTSSTTYFAEIYHKSGKPVLLEISERPINRDGCVVGSQGVARDVTEQHALEAQLRDAQKMQAIGRLAGGVAHDFKNLLMGISGHAEIAQMRIRRGDEPHQEIEAILSCVGKASELATQLLAFSRRQSMQPRPTDLNILIENCQPLLERLLGEHLTVRFDLSPDTCTVDVDPGQIEQVVMNLAINARDAMPQGGELRVSTYSLELAEEDWIGHPGVKPGTYAHLKVSDTGAGIPDEIKEHIFEPFFTTKAEGEGTGLGLSVVYGIVTQHGGCIRVESEAGKGTTFHVYLPAVSAAPHAKRTDSLDALFVGSGTILLAEDEDAVRQPVCRMLEECGYTVLTTSNGAEAVELFKKNADEISLAILDVIMPKIGGAQALEAMREIKPDARILFISGYPSSAFREPFTPPPDVPILSKPFSLAELASKIQELLR